MREMACLPAGPASPPIMLWAIALTILLICLISKANGFGRGWEGIDTDSSNQAMSSIGKGRSRRKRKTGTGRLAVRPAPHQLVPILKDQAPNPEAPRLPTGSKRTISVHSAHLRHSEGFLELSFSGVD